MNKNEKHFPELERLILSGATFLSAEEKFKLLKSGKSPAGMSLDEISFAVKRVFKNVVHSPEKLRNDSIKALKLIHAMDIRSVCIDQQDFPPLLREMRDPPFMIFYRGNLDVLKKKCISVVGTRRCSADGKKSAVDFSKNACDDDCCIVSGLAFGIDSAAHYGALLSKNPATAAVLPGGIDTVVPYRNTKLASAILQKGGLILSEYIPGTPAQTFRYVQRNRLIAALSAQTVVIQAPPGSGAMITADFALDYNRYIFFHNQCFSKEAIALSQISELELREQLAKGKKVEYKINNSPESFVKDGASVISSYEELKKIIDGGDCPKIENQQLHFD